jgi:SAM-dependent methyltransferase
LAHLIGVESARYDTVHRSLAHWSEAKRAGMEAFYELAVQDYRVLARARDWAALLLDRGKESGRVRLLDVACGSGKFPTALVSEGLDSRVGGLSVDVDLLDPSPFSLDEAGAALAPPFRAAASHQVTIEDFEPPRSPYDVVWATHALYAVPPDALAEGLRRMMGSLRPQGMGVIAQAPAASHYIAAHEAYRASFAPAATPFVTAEQIAKTLRELGAELEVQSLRYRTHTSDEGVAELFIQRCVFDDTRSLAQMSAPGPCGDDLARYLAACRQGAGWTFRHQVHLITWEA